MWVWHIASGAMLQCQSSGRASVREARLQLERFGGIGGKRLAERIDLCLHIGHRPRRRAILQNAHVTSEIVPGIRIELWIRRGKSNLY